MKVALDTDMLSTFARVKRLDVLNRLFEKAILPASVQN
jgi:predicted nucleic acid-binding protein